MKKLAAVAAIVLICTVACGSSVADSSGVAGSVGGAGVGGGGHGGVGLGGGGLGGGGGGEGGGGLGDVCQGGAAGNAGAGGHPIGAIGCHYRHGPVPVADRACDAPDCTVCEDYQVCGYNGDEEAGSKWWCGGTPDDPGTPLNGFAPPVFPYGSGYYSGGTNPSVCSYSCGPMPVFDLAGCTASVKQHCNACEICGFTGVVWTCCDPADPSCCADPCDPQCPTYDAAQCFRCSNDEGPVASPNDPVCNHGGCGVCATPGICGWWGGGYWCCDPNNPDNVQPCCPSPNSPGCP